jgi:hypothetical protein
VNVSLPPSRTALDDLAGLAGVPGEDVAELVEAVHGLLFEAPDLEGQDAGGRLEDREAGLEGVTLGIEVMSGHQPMTEAELAEISARCDEATPPPWRSIVEGRDHTSGSSFIRRGEGAVRHEDIELTGASVAEPGLHRPRSAGRSSAYRRGCAAASPPQ